MGFQETLKWLQIRNDFMCIIAYQLEGHLHHNVLILGHFKLLSDGL